MVIPNGFMLKNFLAGGTKCFKTLLKDILKLSQLLYYVFLLKFLLTSWNWYFWKLKIVKFVRFYDQWLRNLVYSSCWTRIFANLPAFCQPILGWVWSWCILSTWDNPGSKTPSQTRESSKICCNPFWNLVLFTLLKPNPKSISQEPQKRDLR